MTKHFPHLFAPITIGQYTLKNRIMNTGHAAHFQTGSRLLNKAKEGRIDDLRPYIACTQSCVGHIHLGLGVGCIYNPVTGREGLRDVHAIGDCYQPRDIEVAVVDGHRVAREI